MRSQLQHDAAPSFWLRTLPLLLGGLALLVRLADPLWNSSVDLAHHYALAARLGQHWLLPAAYDHSLGEMNVYPNGAHVLAALVGRVAGSTLLGLQLMANAAYLAVWAVLLLLLRQLPARAAVLSGVTLGLLLLLNRSLQLAELHGNELIANFFYSQLVGQAGALLALLGAMRLERAGQPAGWRYLLLLAAIGVLCSVHLKPALELLAALALSCALDLHTAWSRGQRRIALLPALLAPLAGALLLVSHPGFAVMRSLSEHDGVVVVRYLNSPLIVGLYAGALLLVSLALLYRWRQAAAADAANGVALLGLKYISLYGAACSLMCVLQSVALVFDIGSAYAVKKYLYGLHTALLLELCLLPALLLGWYRAQDRQPLRRQAVLLLSPLLLALAVLCTLPTSAPLASTAALVRIERQLTDLRALRLAEAPDHYTYVARLDGVSPVVSYMFSIGIFGVPRNSNAGDVLGGRMPSDLSQVGHLLSGPALGGDQRYLGCRQAAAPAGMALLDGACLEAVLNPPGQHIALTINNHKPLCTLNGFSPPEQEGSWTMTRHATVACPVPALVEGKAPTQVLLDTHAFLHKLPSQRLQISVNGGALQTIGYAPDISARQLALPLPTGARVLTLALTLPDARSPLELGIGADQRQLGVMLHAISFQ